MMTKLLKVLYCEDGLADSRLAQVHWRGRLKLTIESTDLDAINLMGCQMFDFILVDNNLQRGNGGAVVRHAIKLGIPCAIFTGEAPEDITESCAIWSKRSLDAVPDMIASAVAHPSSLVVDPAIFDTKAMNPLKTRIYSIFNGRRNGNRQHG